MRPERSEGKAIEMTSKRNIAAILGGIAAVALFLIVNPWFAVDPKSTADQIVTVIFWVSFIALLVVLFEMRKEPGGETIEIEGPAFTRFLFGNSRAGLFWLPIRLFVGFTWLEAGYHKFSGTGWMDGGAALAGLLAARGRGPGRRRRQPGDHLRVVSQPSCRPCSTTTPTPGSPRSSRSVRWPSGSACSSAA